MNKPTKISLAFMLPATMFGVVVFLVWNNQTEISIAGMVIAIGALLLTLWYAKYKDAQDEERRNKSMTIFKRILLFKLIGTLQIIEWTLHSYLSYDVSTIYPTTLKIGYMEVGDFQKQQFDAYKLYYDEIKYFATSEIISIEIKEELDMLNLHAEKLINFLPVTKGKLNHKILSRYINDVLKITKWAIQNEDSDLIHQHAKDVLDWIELLLKLRNLEH